MAVKSVMLYLITILNGREHFHQNSLAATRENRKKPIADSPICSLLQLSWIKQQDEALTN